MTPSACGGTGSSVKRSENLSHPISSIDLGRHTTTTDLVVTQTTTTCRFWMQIANKYLTLVFGVLYYSGLKVPKTTAYKRWNCQVIRPANCCHLIPSNRFLNGFPYASQFAAAKLTYYSTMPHRPQNPRDLGSTSCSQVMCTRILALLPSIHVLCVQATSQVVG